MSRKGTLTRYTASDQNPKAAAQQKRNQKLDSLACVGLHAGISDFFNRMSNL